MKNRNIKVYAKESTIQSFGKGLFALKDIKKESIIVEFNGKIRNSNCDIVDNRSCLHFSDDTILECGANDLASFANDGIDMNVTPRKLIESLKLEQPFYKKYTNATINASIKINHNLHRAFLIAETDIKKDEEIFCHYSFGYWFGKEMTTIGFLYEDEIEKNGFPNDIFNYPAFKCYIDEFYPSNTHFDVKKYKDSFDVIVHFKDGKTLLMPMTDYSNSVSKVIK